MEPYELSGRNTLHLDLYRLQDPAELEQLGLLDTPPDHSLWLVEWPERGGERLPKAGLDIALRASGTGRELLLTASLGLESELNVLLSPLTTIYAPVP